jgi:hypothetical protein
MANPQLINKISSIMEQMDENKFTPAMMIATILSSDASFVRDIKKDIMSKLSTVEMSSDMTFTLKNMFGIDESYGNINKNKLDSVINKFIGELDMILSKKQAAVVAAKIQNNIVNDSKEPKNLSPSSKKTNGSSKESSKDAGFFDKFSKAFIASSSSPSAFLAVKVFNGSGKIIEGFTSEGKSARTEGFLGDLFKDKTPKKVNKGFLFKDKTPKKVNKGKRSRLLYSKKMLKEIENAIKTKQNVRSERDVLKFLKSGKLQRGVLLFLKKREKHSKTMYRKMKAWQVGGLRLGRKRNKILNGVYKTSRGMLKTLTMLGRVGKFLLYKMPKIIFSAVSKVASVIGKLYGFFKGGLGLLALGIKIAIVEALLPGLTTSLASFAGSMLKPLMGFLSTVFKPILTTLGSSILDLSTDIVEKLKEVPIFKPVIAIAKGILWVLEKIAGLVWMLVKKFIKPKDRLSIEDDLRLERKRVELARNGDRKGFLNTYSKDDQKLMAHNNGISKAMERYKNGITLESERERFILLKMLKAEAKKKTASGAALSYEAQQKLINEKYIKITGKGLSKSEIQRASRAGIIDEDVANNVSRGIDTGSDYFSGKENIEKKLKAIGINTDDMTGDQLKTAWMMFWKITKVRADRKESGGEYTADESAATQNDFRGFLRTYNVARADNLSSEELTKKYITLQDDIKSNSDLFKESLNTLTEEFHKAVKESNLNGSDGPLSRIIEILEWFQKKPTTTSPTESTESIDATTVDPVAVRNHRQNYIETTIALG